MNLIIIAAVIVGYTYSSSQFVMLDYEEAQCAGTPWMIVSVDLNAAVGSFSDQYSAQTGGMRFSPNKLFDSCTNLSCTAYAKSSMMVKCDDSIGYAQLVLDLWVAAGLGPFDDGNCVCDRGQTEYLTNSNATFVYPGCGPAVASYGGSSKSLCSYTVGNEYLRFMYFNQTQYTGCNATMDGLVPAGNKVADVWFKKDSCIRIGVTQWAKAYLDGVDSVFSEYNSAGCVTPTKSYKYTKGVCASQGPVSRRGATSSTDAMSYQGEGESTTPIPNGGSVQPPVTSGSSGVFAFSLFAILAVSLVSLF